MSRRASVAKRYFTSSSSRESTVTSSKDAVLAVPESIITICNCYCCYSIDHALPGDAGTVSSSSAPPSVVME
jgi:hypothetical protein